MENTLKIVYILKIFENIKLVFEYYKVDYKIQHNKISINKNNSSLYFYI